MPRQKRVFSITHIYHVMVRGNAGRDIFRDDEDREKFLKILWNKRRKQEFILYAYCLMRNHFHLILKEYKDNISHIMKRVNTTYALYFNKKYQLTGHLFQNRFRSEAVESDEYLLEVVRYIHNNPIKAGLVALPQDYRWSSYLSYIGSQDKNRIEYQMVYQEDILRMFSKNTSQALSQFMEFSGLQEEKFKFMEYKENNHPKKELNSELKVQCYIDQFLNRNSIAFDLLSERKNKSIREKLVRELKEKSIYSEREIAQYLKVSRGVIQRIIGKKEG